MRYVVASPFIFRVVSVKGHLISILAGNWLGLYFVNLKGSRVSGGVLLKLGCVANALKGVPRSPFSYFCLLLTFNCFRVLQVLRRHSGGMPRISVHLIQLMLVRLRYFTQVVQLGLLEPVQLPSL